LSFRHFAFSFHPRTLERLPRLDIDRTAQATAAVPISRVPSDGIRSYRAGPALAGTRLSSNKNGPSPLLPEDLELLALGGFRVDPDGLAPRTVCQPAWRRPRLPNRAELQLLVDCARAILAVDAKAEFRPKPWRPRQRQILEIVIEPGSHGRDARARMVRRPALRTPATLDPERRAHAERQQEDAARRLTEEILSRNSSWSRGLGKAVAPGALPKTLAEWKHADREFLDQALADIHESEPHPRLALCRYFGSEELSREVFRELKDLLPTAGFMEWYFADYRATRRSKTYFERLLGEIPLEPVDRILIEARQRCRFSIFRVDSTVPGATLEVEDVLTGDLLTIHDRALSGCGLEGCFALMRILRLGAWDTCVVCGPPMSVIEMDHALRDLRARRVELTPDGLRRAAHVAGRFWARELERNSNPSGIGLTNTDGDPLEPLIATFRVEDPAVVEAKLHEQNDLGYDSSSRFWTWLRPKLPNRELAGSTILGRIQVIGNELLLEVNSGLRLVRARDWIEQLPGVRFVRALSRPIDAAAPRDDVDDRVRAPIRGEARAHLEGLYREQCRCWLDTHVPALGNKTPREACKTEGGRRLVAVMVRTMPPALIPGGSIPPPRRELLRELGLDTKVL